MSGSANNPPANPDPDSLPGFRAEVRAWLAAHCPASMRCPAPEDETVWGGRREIFKNPDSKIWLEAMAQRGWTCPQWPREYGGGGLNREENKILQQELRTINARAPLMSYGIAMLGPVLLEFGNEAQKREHLPKIARGEIRWCQGYSEPGAGSDLASLQCRAEDRGDHFLVNGSKIWTSYADLSDWIFCLVRTSSAGSKHQGISFVLIDMASQGVSTRPIVMISGRSPFCQTFFDDVQVPKANLVGELNQGWPIAKRLLSHERNFVSTIGGTTALGESGRRVHELAKQYADVENGRIGDAVLRDRIAAYNMDSRAFQLTLARVAEEARDGRGNPHLGSMFKYYGTELNQRKYELMLECLGVQGLGWEDEGFDAKELKITRQWLRSKANSIEGGTSEIQLNIIAKRILELPE